MEEDKGDGEPNFFTGEPEVIELMDGQFVEAPFLTNEKAAIALGLELLT